MSSLAEYGIEAKPAEARELEGMLVTCKVGLATTETVILLRHIAWMQERYDRLIRRSGLGLDSSS